MKKIGTSVDGNVMIEIEPVDLTGLRIIIGNRMNEFWDLLLDDLFKAVGLPTAKPNEPRETAAAAAAPKAKKPRRATVEERKPAAGKLGKRVCAGCGKEFQAVRKDQKNCSKKCGKNSWRNNAEKLGPSRTRTVTCVKCKKPFVARLFGPAPRHCPACRPGAKQVAVAPNSPTKPEDTAKAARLDTIRRLALREAGELEKDVISGVQHEG
jgi:hypothetical protein